MSAPVRGIGVPFPPPSPHRSPGTLRRPVSVIALLAFVALVLLSLLAGAVSLVQARHGFVELWLPAAPATAPSLVGLSPQLSSDGYSLLQVEVSGVSFDALGLYVVIQLAGYAVFAGISFFLAYLSYRVLVGRPFGRVVTSGLAVCAALLVGLSLVAPGLFALAQQQILAELAVDLSRAPFTTDYRFTVEDALLFFAGVLLGLLALVFAAAESLLPGPSGADVDPPEAHGGRGQHASGGPGECPGP